MNQKQIRAAVEAMLFAYAATHQGRQAGPGGAAAHASVESALEALHTRCQEEDSGLCLLHLDTMAAGHQNGMGGLRPPRAGQPAAPYRWARRPWRP